MHSDTTWKGEALHYECSAGRVLQRFKLNSTVAVVGF